MDRAGEFRAHLLALCADECLPPALVHGLSDADLIDIIEWEARDLRAFLHLIERRHRMGAGQVPTTYIATAHCDGCGPIWWYRAERLLACPWCLIRRAGRVIPQPPVRCGDCCHYLPDPLNPEAGTGTCASGHGARCPMQHHHCPAMRVRADCT